MTWLVDDNGDASVIACISRFADRKSAMRHARSLSSQEPDNNIPVWDEANPGEGPIVYRNGKRDKKRFVWLPEGDE